MNLRKPEGKLMATMTITEQTILEELHQLPQERWGQVLMFLRTLQQGRPAPTVKRPIVAGADLRDSDLIGMWADRTDISDSREFARKLRDRAEKR
jgi:hypothetical protein